MSAATETETVDPRSYDRVIVAFSGGKDSLACLLHLIELDVDKARIELWHHDVDGREGSPLMDWPCTRDYCRRVAAAIGVPIFFSWKEGGFTREMSRDGAPTAPIRFETPDGWLGAAGGRGPVGTRKVFPQVSPDLSVRWCSAYLKIDVCAAAIRNQARFLDGRTLVVTGERAEESPSRAKYRVLEPHRADLRGDDHGDHDRASPPRRARKTRHVDQWRPVHAWSERDVWAIIERHRINPHPAYRLGWGRVSCAACIFGSANQWASLRAVSPAQFDRVAGYETRWGKTIQRKLSVVQLADKGTPYANMSSADVAAATRETFDEPVFLDTWRMPSGAFGDASGPT